MPRIVHFEFSASEPDRAIKFFGNVFGWQFNNMGGGDMEYWFITTGPDGELGINGGMMRKGPIPPTAFTIQVDSLDESEKKITEAGGSISAVKMPIPGVGWFSKFKDTEGNEFGMMQPDEQAK